MIDRVRFLWAALRDAGPPTEADLAIRSIDAPGVGAILGIDRELRPHLLLRVHEQVGLDPPVEAIHIEVRRLLVDDGEHLYLDVVCCEPSLDFVFDHFVVAVIDRVCGGEPAVPAVDGVLEAWKRFLVAGDGGPGGDLLSAMTGELILLTDLVRADSRRRVDVWQGPQSARHDFRRGGTAIEVKTTRSHTGFRVTIHGEDQLDEPSGGALYLHFVRLEDVPDGSFSVPDLVEGLIALGASRLELYAAVEKAGLGTGDFESARQTRFEVRSRLTFRVDGSFPRIVPSTFLGGARPAGVDDLTYKIDLATLVSLALDDASFAALAAQISEVSQ